MNWQEALEKLKAGNARFSSDQAQRIAQDGAARAALVDAQHPYAIVLSCADSRVVPEFIFDAGLGEIFVVRVAGNVADAAVIAGIEYAVSVVDTKLIVVMAHESCGAVTTVVDSARGSVNKDMYNERNKTSSKDNNTDIYNSINIRRLTDLIMPAVAESTSDDVDLVSRINCRNSATALTRDSALLRDAVENKGVCIVTAFYHYASGQVDFD